MSKMSDMAQTIEELRSAAAAITDAANWLAQQFSGEDTTDPVPEAQPEKKPELTLEQVRAVLADKSRAGHTAAVRDLLQKYGASKLSQVDHKHYETLLKDAEVIGNAVVNCALCNDVLNHHSFSGLTLPPETGNGLLVQFQTPGESEPHQRGTAGLKVESMSCRSRVDQRHRDFTVVPPADALLGGAEIDVVLVVIGFH